MNSWVKKIAMMKETSVLFFIFKEVPAMKSEEAEAIIASQVLLSERIILNILRQVREKVFHLKCSRKKRKKLILKRMIKE